MSERTLLVTLAGPQQSWGSRSRFATRSTELAPTRSGVLGLVAAALGLDRTEPLGRFDGIRFGVRVDQPGRVERDFQTARTLDGRTSMPLSHRHYLADAVFLAGLASDDNGLLSEFQAALRQPRFPLYLGRRAFPPAGPLRTEIVDLPLREALATASWRASAHARPRGGARLELLVDAEPGERADFSIQDVPHSFDPRRRVHTWRDVVISQVTPPGLEMPSTPAPDPDRRRLPAHDPMLLVSEEEV